MCGLSTGAPHRESVVGVFKAFRNGRTKHTHKMRNAHTTIVPVPARASGLAALARVMTVMAERRSAMSHLSLIIMPAFYVRRARWRRLRRISPLARDARFVRVGLFCAV